MSFHAKLLSGIFASWLSKSLNNKGTLTCPRVLFNIQHKGCRISHHHTEDTYLVLLLHMISFPY